MGNEESISEESEGDHHGILTSLYAHCRVAQLVEAVKLASNSIAFEKGGTIGSVVRDVLGTLARLRLKSPNFGKG